MTTTKRMMTALLLTVALATASPALASSAWVSVPSTPDASDKVVITGGNLTPFTTVRLAVIDGNGAKNEQLRTVSAEGTLSAEIIPGTPGSYTVKAYDQDGNEIGGGVFGYIK